MTEIKLAINEIGRLPTMLLCLLFEVLLMLKQICFTYSSQLCPIIDNMNDKSKK